MNLFKNPVSYFYFFCLFSFASEDTSIQTSSGVVDGIVVKNIGDALLFYFPVIHSEQKTTLQKCLNCCLTIAESHKDSVTQLKKEKLPILDYRISATYGIVRIAKTSTSSVNDIFGSTVNRCAKINRSAPANGLIIGHDFYNNAKTFEHFIYF